MAEEGLMEKIVSLCKRRGFVYQGSEIYGGLAGTWDYGPLGVALKKNIENLWWRMFVESRDDMYGIDSAILMNPKVWEASGHVSGFADPLVECSKCKHRFRADHLDNLEKCPDCGGKLGEARQFNMMFKTSVGSVDSSDTTVYMRPETAQGMFVNFKNIIDSHHPKLPFGIAQTGKAFRNEIAPRDFVFRVRELEIMEFEYFIKEEEWQKQFEYWQTQMREWFKKLGFGAEDIKEIEIPDGERAHYSKRTVDFHFNYPHKFDEIGGLAYRTDFDLKNHIEKSGVDLSYLDPNSNERFVPHVLEPTFGVGRHLLAVLVKAYTEDELGGEKRIVLKFPPHLAPVKAAVFPLLKNKPELVEKAREIYTNLKKEIPQIVWDDNGNIGKRYRRQDEIGTPYCITVDFDTLGEKPELKDTVTLRDRDTGEQKRVSIAELPALLRASL
ncbi:MAG: glycine--tRNA ligase [Candidatus Adlerbacteria bacterium]|nr:glycine--tRNA ligase [Candidatus Adlerbacteria bacterium]